MGRDLQISKDIRSDLVDTIIRGGGVSMTRRLSERIFKPVKRNLLKIRITRSAQAATKREASMKLVKRYFRLIR